MDKGYMKGRLRIAVALMVAVAAIVALPAMAQAATTASQYPAPSATLHAAPAAVSVDVFGAVLDAKTAKLTIAGTDYVADVANSSNGGAWTSTEVLDGNVYKTLWTWTAGAAGAKATVTAYPAGLVAGPVSVALSVKDTAGNAISDSWSFTLAANGTNPVVPPAAVANQTCRSANCHGTTFDTDNAMGPKCASCHSGGFAPHGFSASEVYGVNDAVSGHNTTLLGKVGANTSFPTLQWESEITSASLTATWMVGGQGPVYAPLVNGVPITSITTGQVGTLSTQWELPTQSVFWPANSTEAPSTAVKGLSWNSVITCEDCHTGLAAAGPQGAAAANFGLDTNYPAPYEYAELTKYVTANQAWPTTNSNYNTALSVSGIAMFPGAATKSAITSAAVNTIPTGASSALANRTDGTSGATAVICAKCHKLETWIPTSAGGVTLGGGAVEGANTAHDSHHQDQTDGSAQCVNCHIGLPHGWKRPRLLVNTDADTAPFLSPLAIGTTRTTWTGAGAANPGSPINLTGKTVDVQGTTVTQWGKGFNQLGLQSLSAVDNHTLQRTTLGHQGLATWTEASCQACGDHAGEDGIRIKEAE